MMYYAMMQDGQAASSTPLRIRIRGLSDEGGPLEDPSTAKQLRTGADSRQDVQASRGPAGHIRPITSPLQSQRLSESLWMPDPDLSDSASLQLDHDTKPNVPVGLSTQQDHAADEDLAVHQSMLSKASDAQDQAAATLDEHAGAADVNSAGHQQRSGTHDAEMHGSGSNEVAIISPEAARTQALPDASLSGAASAGRTFLTFSGSSASSSEV